MGSNLQRLRAMKAANQQKESDLSTSFSIDEGGAVPEDSAADIQEASDTTPTPDQITENPVLQPTNEGAEANNASDTIKPIAPNSSISPINKTEASEPERNIGLRLASAEDKRYLDLAPLSRSMTKKAFFIELMRTEFENMGHININDPQIEHFRESPLKTTAITISVPETLIVQIKQYSAKHMMKYQRYVAYIINKARMNDEDWQQMM
ncbi:MAG: hypothetical protein IJ682_02235 [Lachnospiraceae bacterium]|nr:hypothetical protein [Lachnospiraceae bacterium]